MKKILTKSIILILTLFVNQYANATETIKVYLHDKCNDSPRNGYKHICSDGSECVDGVCKLKSNLSPETKSCKERLAKKGVDKKTIISVYGGYCYLDCAGMYEAINAARSNSPYALIENNRDLYQAIYNPNQVKEYYDLSIPEYIDQYLSMQRFTEEEKAIIKSAYDSIAKASDREQTSAKLDQAFVKISNLRQQGKEMAEMDRICNNCKYCVKDS